MDKIIYSPIGVVHSPYKEPKGTPIQSQAAKGVKGYIEVYNEYKKGLKDLEGFSYIYLLLHFHLSKGYSLEVKPFMDNDIHGVFSTRAPKRPNSIGLSIVYVLKVKDNIIYVEDLDIVDKTPVLDIKPYVPNFDLRKCDKIGWLEKNIHKLPKIKDDGRFIE